MKIKLENKVYNLPDSWDHVTIHQFMQMHEINTNEELEELEKIVKIISLLGNIPLGIIEKGNINQINDVFNKLTFLTSEPAVNSNSSVIINGDEYYFDKENFDRNMTYEMFSDLKYLLNNDANKNMNKILAILLRKVNKTKYNYNKWKGFRKSNYKSGYDVEKYKSENIEKEAEVMKNVAVSEVYSIILFFYLFSGSYLKMTTSNYFLKNQEQKEV